MPGRVRDDEMDVQGSHQDGVTTLPSISVALTAAALKPVVDALVDDGAVQLVVDIGGVGGVGDVRSDVFDDLARERVYLRERGGEPALVGSPSDAQTITDSGFREAVSFFDGTENAVSYVRDAASGPPS